MIKTEIHISHEDRDMHRQDLSLITFLAKAT
jgi:hypothetical protein